MKLYYTPGACSLSPHIVLREAGLTFDLEQVDLASKRTKSGADYKAVNPKGAVPALQLDDGQILTEGPSIVQYLADRKPEAKLAPAAGTMERYRLQEWLHLLTSALHKAIGALFNPNLPDAWKTVLKDKLAVHFSLLSKTLEKQPYLMGQRFTIADAYLFNILSWTKHVGIDLGPYPVLTAFMSRVAARPAVQAALKAEGLAN